MRRLHMLGSGRRFLPDRSWCFIFENIKKQLALAKAYEAVGKFGGERWQEAIKGNVEITVEAKCLAFSST